MNEEAKITRDTYEDFLAEISRQSGRKQQEKDFIEGNGFPTNFRNKIIIRHKVISIAVDIVSPVNCVKPYSSNTFFKIRAAALI